MLVDSLLSTRKRSNAALAASRCVLPHVTSKCSCSNEKYELSEMVSSQEAALDVIGEILRQGTHSGKAVVCRIGSCEVQVTAQRWMESHLLHAWNRPLGGDRVVIFQQRDLAPPRQPCRLYSYVVVYGDRFLWEGVKAGRQGAAAAIQTALHRFDPSSSIPHGRRAWIGWYSPAVLPCCKRSSRRNPWSKLPA